MKHLRQQQQQLEEHKANTTEHLLHGDRLEMALTTSRPPGVRLQQQQRHQQQEQLQQYGGGAVDYLDVLVLGPLDV